MQDDQINSPSTSRRLSDPIDPARARALQIAMGSAADIEGGTALPPFFHQIYFWEPQPPAALGRDGHPATGGGDALIPDLGLPRRMWAGGRLEFLAPLRAGMQADKITTVDSTAKKDGRSGPLAFVTLRHEITQDGQLALREFQDLVYREDPDPAAPAPTPPMARTDETIAEPARFDSTLLFRYSALTFNGHRIHYDLDYARDVEGYGGLVVHGPYLAQLLMLLAARQLGGLKRFAFRATSPVMHDESVLMCYAPKAGGGADLWVRGADGRQSMIAEAD